MYDRRNVIVMFLLIMLSFAIITEVSAAGEAEINGTGPDPSMMPDGIANPDIAGERFNENQMQDHFDADDFQSHDGQKSCNKTPERSGDNKCNETLYENMDLDKSPEFKHLDNMSNGMFDGVKPADNMSDGMFDENVSEFEFNHKALGESDSSDLRNNNFTDLTNNGELMNDVVSNLIGLNNLAPNFSKNDRNVSHNNAKDSKPMGDKGNESAPLISGGKNTSDIGSFNIDKNTKAQKIIKKSNKKVKSIKKPKKVNKKIFKKSKKERAKL